MERQVSSKAVCRIFVRQNPPHCLCTTNCRVPPFTLSSIEIVIVFPSEDGVKRMTSITFSSTRGSASIRGMPPVRLPQSNGLPLEFRIWARTRNTCGDLAGESEALSQWHFLSRQHRPRPTK